VERVVKRLYTEQEQYTSVKINDVVREAMVFIHAGVRMERSENQFNYLAYKTAHTYDFSVLLGNMVLGDFKRNLNVVLKKVIIVLKKRDALGLGDTEKLVVLPILNEIYDLATEWCQKADECTLLAIENSTVSVRMMVELVTAKIRFREAVMRALKHKVNFFQNYIEIPFEIS
jgi:hypothetical protein